MQHADGAAHEGAHGSNGDCAEDARNVVAAPKAEKETHRAENGGDGIVYFSYEVARGELRSTSQEAASP